MPIFTNNRRLRVPQNPFAKIAYKVALTLLVAIIFFVLFAKLTVSRYNNNPYFEDDDPDISGSSDFRFTNYQAAINKTGTRFWNAIKPGFYCPKDQLTKVGISGEKEDSGKWLCGLKNLAKLEQIKGSKPPCVVYSFVYEGEGYLEAEILQQTNCSVYLYDPTRELLGDQLDLGSGSNSRLHFDKLTIGGEERFNRRTLELLMELNGHKWIDILRIDVKSGEYMALERILNDFRTTMPFGQLLIKFYVPDWTFRRRSRWMASLFEILEKRGLRLYFVNVNPYGASPCCSDMSFINVKNMGMFLSQYEIQEAIDYSLDF